MKKYILFRNGSRIEFIENGKDKYQGYKEPHIIVEIPFKQPEKPYNSIKT